MKDQMNWKSIWQMASGLHQDTPSDKVREKLLEVTEDLRDGLLKFQTNTSGSDTKLEKLLKDARQEKLLPLTKHLQKYLNLDADQTWSTLCSYLVNEYKGSPGSLAAYVSNDTNKSKLIADIWNYYSLERMIILKLIKTLLEFQMDKRHPYHTVYADVLSKIGVKTLKSKIIDQLTGALKDDPECQPGYSVADHNESNKQCMLLDRKLREINELVQLLILIGQLEGPADPDELKLLLNVFKNSSFLQKCRYNISGESSSLLQKIEHSRVILLLHYIHQCPSDFRVWSSAALKEVDEAIVSAQQCVENSPLFLSWMIKNFKAISIDETLNDTLNSRSYQGCGSRAIKMEVFKFLLSILNTKTYQSKPPNLLANTARRTIYNTLNDLCDLFDGDGSVAQHSGVYDLLAELLVTPSIAVDFMKAHANSEESSGSVSLYNTAIELFPSEFVPISKIAAALASSGTKNGSEFIKTQLESLPVFTELYSGKQYDLQPLGNTDSEDEFLLTKDYYPMRQFALKIQRGTRVAIMDRRKVTYVHFWSPCNYFQVLHNEMRELLSSGDAEENLLIARVTAGVQYLRYMLKRLKSPGDITDAMVHPVELVFDLLLKFKSVPHPPVTLMASCLDVCSALSAFFDQEVLKRVLNLGLFPAVSNTGFSNEEYARGTGFDSGLIGQYLINYENGNGTYPFLKSYFGFLTAYKQNQGQSKDTNAFAVELPGLVFMLREIFPHCHTWRFEKESDLHEIYVFVMEYFFDILQSEKVLLRDTCVYSLLNLENGLTLLKFVGIGNPFLQAKMEAESNWPAAINTGLNSIVQLSMTILMQILRKKRIVAGEGALSPLETIVYTQPKQRDTLRIIPVVTSYMNNIFNKRLPILSCRLLRRFAIEFQMSLLACLDMEQDHIRMTFLQRLRDESGSNELKIAILEFVEACLDKQPGLVEAFFDIRYDKEKKRPKMHTEGIPAYMEEYLDAISKEPEKVASPLLSRIMSLFHVVWRNNMQSLIRNLIESKTFWSALCTPLFMNINMRSLKVYSQLFNILGLEVFKFQNNDLSVELESTLKKFLDLSSFESWLKYLLDSELESPNTTGGTSVVAADEAPEWLCRMQSFKDFLCIVIKKKPQLMSSRARCLLLNRLIIEIMKRIEEANRTDSRALVILSELYLLVLVNSDSPKYTDSVAADKRLFHDVAQILSFLATSYEDVIARVRVAILGFSLRITLTYDQELGMYSEIGTQLVQSTVAIICQELGWLENGLAEGQTNVPLLLSLQLLQKLLMINYEHRFFDWESVSAGPKILFRFLGSLQRISSRYADRKVTLALLEVLTSIARTLDTNEFLFCDIGDYLWLTLLPPKALLRDPFQKAEVLASKQEDWAIQEWWPIYDEGIELVTVLLQKHGSLFVEQAITFLGIHEEYLIDSLNLVRESLEPRAMSLIKKTVALICECTRFRKTWQLEHPQSICNLMRSVQILTEQLISLMYRPNLLKMLLDGRPNNDGLVDLSAPIAATPELVSALNAVIEIIISCIKALMAFSPPLMELICASTFTPLQWHALIEIQFGAPKFNDSVQPLSFGTLLSAVGTFTKTLGLIQFNFQDSPLNFSHADTTAGGKEETRTAFSPSRLPYNKTLSVTGIGNQTLVNCNEILSSLDGKLCMVALECILTLLLSQSYLAIKDTHLSIREKQLIKRELSAELGILNEFLKKKLALDNIGTLSRKKYGSTPILNELGDMVMAPRVDKQVTSQQHQRRLSQPRDSMRVNVVRRLHLQQKVLPNVQGSTPHKEANRSQVTFENITPIKRAESGGQSSSKSDLDAKRTCYRDPDIEYLELEEPTDAGLSTVKIVEADYLHALSNMFAVLCHSEK